jgi:hypothetical protein
MQRIAAPKEREDYQRHVSLHDDASETKYVFIICLPLSDHFASYVLKMAETRSITQRGQHLGEFLTEYVVSCGTSGWVKISRTAT